MSIYRGPILSVAAPYEVQQRLRDAAQARIARNGPSAPAEYLERRRATAARLVDRGRSAVSGWLSAQARRRAWLVPSLDR
jgi:hypothetical protein